MSVSRALSQWLVKCGVSICLAYASREISAQCIFHGRADLWTADGFNGSYFRPQHGYNASGELMLIAGASYTFGGTEVRTAPTVWMIPPSAVPYSAPPRGLWYGPSLWCQIDGAFKAWNEHTFTASTTANSTAFVSVTPQWIPTAYTPCGASLIPGNFNAVGTRTYLLSIGAVGFAEDHPLHQYVGASTEGIAIDQPDGTSFTWDLANSINNPVAYTRGKRPRIWARIDVSPSVDSTLDVPYFRIRLGSAVVSGPWSLPFSGNNYSSSPVELNFTEYTVGKRQYTLSWEVSTDGEHWISIGDSGPHTIYWTYEAPLFPTFQARNGGVVFPPLYDKALDNACGYANGRTTPGPIYEDISSQISTYVIYNPTFSTQSTFHPLDIYRTGGYCSDQTALARGLLRSLGLPAKVLYLFGGSSSMFGYEFQTTNGKWATAKFNRPMKDGWPANRHFLFHAVCWAGGGSPLYDPSYGDSYQFWTATEMEPAAIEQSTDNFWAILFDIGPNNFICPHIE